MTFETNIIKYCIRLISKQSDETSELLNNFYVFVFQQKILPNN